MKISCLGDSVTSGWGVRAEETWVSLLNAEGAHQFCNDGLIGDTLTGMLSRLDSQILPGKPDMVIILGGWNDLLLCKSPDTAKSALMATVHHCVRAGVIPVVAAIRSFGVEATLSGRNDILVNGAKISGNAQYYRYGRVIHHGTILFSSDLEILSRVLNVDRSKFQGKGIASVESRVTNLSAHLPADVGLMDLRRRLREYIME